MTYVKTTLKIGPNIPKYLFQSYVHRSGRTARAKKEGLSVMLIDPSENQFYRRMCRTLNRDEDLGPVSDVYCIVTFRVYLFLYFLF